MKQNDNILDSLFTTETNEEAGNINLLSDEIVVPKRCATCKTSIVCSILPNIISLSKIKVYVTIEKCPYYQPIRQNEQR